MLYIIIIIMSTFDVIWHENAAHENTVVQYVDGGFVYFDDILVANL